MHVVAHARYELTSIRCPRSRLRSPVPGLAIDGGESGGTGVLSEVRSLTGLHPAGPSLTFASTLPSCGGRAAFPFMAAVLDPFLQAHAMNAQDAPFRRDLENRRGRGDRKPAAWVRSHMRQVQVRGVV